MSLKAPMLDTIADLQQRLNVTPASVDPRGRVDLLLQLGLQKRGVERWDEIWALASEAKELAESIGYTAGIAGGLGLQAFALYVHSDYEQALAYAMKALALAQGDADGEGKVRTVLSLVHWSIGNFDEALRHCDRSCEQLRESGDRIGEGFALTIRGGILHGLGEYHQALAAHRKSLDVFSVEDFPLGVARAFAGIGGALHGLGRSDEARQAHQHCLDLSQSLNHQLNISRALNDLGELAEAQGDLDSALQLHSRALEIRKGDTYRQAEVTSRFNLGQVYRKKGLLNEAAEMLSSGLTLAEEIGVRPKICQIQQALAEVCEQNGDLANAIRHLRAYDRVKSELASGQSNLRHKALELEAQLEFARKDAEIHRLRNVELARLVEELQLTQARLVISEKMAAVGGLVAGVAHEINSPLGVIRSASDTTVRCAERIATTATDSRIASVAEALKASSHLISEATGRIKTLVTRLKSFAGIDRADYSEFDLIGGLDDVIALLEPTLSGRVMVNRTYGEVPRIYCYAAEISQVFMHLLRNAAEAIEGAGEITIRTDCDTTQIRIAVVDTGRGIPANEIPHLFNPSFNRHEQRVKVSLSLFICQSITSKHGGDIHVSSTSGKGSTFTIVLPRALENAEWKLPEVSSMSA
jgi:signal transduction histidine kinase/tetratricopeptide (TPR) repeat protein